MKKKTSCGIILAKIVNNKLYIVCVRRRANYGFYDIVNGNYDHSSNESILKRLRQTTIDEKYLLSQMNYDHIYFHAYMTYNYKKYAKERFTKTFMRDGGKRLHNLLQISPNQGYLWGIPKGRKTSNETNLSCAVREFEEETKISAKDYELLRVDPIRYTHIDNNVEYENIYYIATPKSRSITPRIDLKNKLQIGEIIETKWMSITQIEDYFPPKLYKSIEPSIKEIKKYINNR